VACSIESWTTTPKQRRCSAKPRHNTTSLDRDRCRAASAGAPDGSFYFDNQPNPLDQFLVNKNMVTGNAPIKVDPASVEVFKLPAMINPGV
jgi:hypothetical protein